MNVIVTGVSGGAVGEQIMKALLLANKNYNILAVDANELAVMFNKSYFIPKLISSTRTNPNEYLDTLVSASKEFSIEAIFLGSEPEILLVNQNREMFNHTYLALNDFRVIQTCSNKIKTIEFLKKNNFTFPRTESICSVRDLDKVDYFPAVLKPSESSSGSKNVYIAQNQHELHILSNYLLSYGLDIIAQEYIGTKNDEYTVGVLSDPDGNIVNSIVMNRIISSGLGSKFSIINKSGKKELGNELYISSGISQGKFIKRSAINDKCEEIAKALGSKGPLNIQCRFVNGSMYVFEINPRLSGTTSSRARVGYNEPDMLIDMWINKKKVNPQHQLGYVMRSIEENYMGNI